MPLSLKLPRRTLAAGAALLVAGAGAVSAAPATAAPPPSVPAASSTPHVSYVNLGDSYAAGWGADAPAASVNPDVGWGNCLVGGRPDEVTLLSELKNVSLAGDFACTGATVGTNTTGRPTIGEEIAAASAARKLTTTTNLVTVSAGGNDIDFGTIIGVCARGTLGDCQQAAAAALLKARQIDVAGTVAAIHAAAKHAVVAWVGYPHLFAANGGGVMSPAAASVFNQGTDALNAELAGLVGEAGRTEGVRTQYVNVTPNFSGHEIGSADSWFNLSFTDPQLEPFNFHPTAEGYLEGYYPAMASQISIARPAV
ncbi:GDSL-type esterase/lipase family protein [Sinomonas sp. RB5]